MAYEDDEDNREAAILKSLIDSPKI
ncbi:uncharacterized protein G2W53_013585 [Senna tora]|uniref:Uncharacterized protein n=1 Tax=Senna tora TaxID=362788 RepID=A0A834U0V5_9FABA|nr:uncharacterized protein G2W53_013585 [Senna tora]